MKHILVSGSCAYDTLLHFEWSLKKEFESHDISSALNMSLLSSTFEKNHGGTWANIAYNLGLLWEFPILLTSIGDDYIFSDSIKKKVNLNYVHKQLYCHSANSIIISDSDDNRFTVFHPWAMKYAGESKLSFVKESIAFAIVSANDIFTMLSHAKQLQSWNVKLILDPAQQISQMNQDQLREFLSYGDILIVNHYEYKDLQARSSMSEENLISSFETLIVTYGAEWSQIFHNGEIIHIPVISVPDIVDTTGCWDAYRAAFIFGMKLWFEMKLCAQLWTLLASYSIISPGSQQHHFSLGSIMEDMKINFDVEIDLYKQN